MAVKTGLRCVVIDSYVSLEHRARSESRSHFTVGDEHVKALFLSSLLGAVCIECEGKTPFYVPLAHVLRFEVL